jgi:catechol 2,3-dioxygenase-like lactoylglutathione lyase family enzyme
MQLNHLHLHVASIDEAEAFYAGHFGFRRHVVQDDGTLFMRDAGGLDLALAAGPPDNFQPWAHFGFRLEDPAAVRGLYDRLTARASPSATRSRKNPTSSGSGAPTPTGT